MSLLDCNDSLDDDEWSDSNIKTCKICYDVDGDVKDIEWSSPCKCSGTIKWVHKSCLEKWMKNAPLKQQSQCNTCKFPYRRCWNLKPVEKWSKPALNLSTWDVIEISLDIYSTVKLVRGTIAMAEGRKSVIGQFCYFIFWRVFIFNPRRIEYYKNLLRSLVATVFETSIIDAES